MSEYTDAPKTLNDSGKPPETRIGDAASCLNRINLLIKADAEDRSIKRSRVKGLVDGNPPYRQTDLRNGGRADACNVNWRTAESYLNNARGAFYDVQNEVPQFASIVTSLGGRKKKEWSDIITEEFHWLIRNHDEDFDYEMQISQYEMVLYGCGPLMFEDTYCFKAIAIPNRNLLVPNNALSRPSKWEECAALVDWNVDTLYRYIRRGDAAKTQGWNIEATRQAIIRASPMSERGGEYRNWEWHQQQLKNNSCSYSAESKTVHCAHYFVREFPEGNEDYGRITHAIVLLTPHEQKKEDFLFKKVGRFESWKQLIHPMYYDNDGGGYHHSVTGMGRKMYSAMDAENKLLCDAYDKVFAPKQLFKPTTNNGNEILKIIKMGNWGTLPPGFDSVQLPVQSFLEEPLILHRTLKGLISSNLSQYRQNMEEKSGNPITAEEMRFRASNVSQLGKTQLNHFWNQLDWYYAEKYRRAAEAKNQNLPGGKAAYEFQKRCEARGVPLDALKKVESVMATRTIGQGSPFMRQQIATQLLGSSQFNPSAAGRNNIYKDYVSAHAGQAMTERYSPEIANAPAQSDQQAIAMLQVAAARTGIPPIVSPNQDDRIFAETFMAAMSQSLTSLEQGGNPMEVHQFIETLGPATVQHIQSLAEDPRNKQIAAQLEKEWRRIAGMADKLAARIQQMQQQAQERSAKQQRAQAMMNGTDPDVAIKAAEVKGKLNLKAQQQQANLALKTQKQRHDMALTGAKARQDIAIKDVTTANEILNEKRMLDAKEANSDEA